MRLRRNCERVRLVPRRPMPLPLPKGPNGEGWGEGEGSARLTARLHNWFLLFPLCLFGALLLPDTFAAEGQEPIDWNHARAIYQKSRDGETLTAEEQAYLARAIQARQRAAQAGQTNVGPQGTPDSREIQRARALLQKQNSGQQLTAEETAFLQRVREERMRAPGLPPNPRPPRSATGLMPLDQLTQSYKGEDGGLYGGGRNQPPPRHQHAAEAAAAKIVPLGADGKPAPNGKIGLLSIGMSNTTQEFSKFKQRADGDPNKSPAVILIDGAQGGQDAADWNNEPTAGRVWQTVAERLRAAGVSPEQVQAIWLKQALKGPARLGEYPKHAQVLKGELVTLLQSAAQRFPNLRIAYLSSRIYAGYASTPLNPEPYAYESAFAVRRVILDQIKGDPQLSFDPARSERRAPLLLWGPYLWADGLTPRKSDGLTWTREDLAGDGTHPSPTSGREKVAKLLLHFFKTDPSARGWFVRETAQATSK